MVFERTSRLALSIEMFLFVFAYADSNAVLIVVVKSDGNCRQDTMVRLHWDFNKQFIILSLQNLFLACIAFKGLPHSLTTNLVFFSRYFCEEISLFISKYQSWWLGQCIEIAGSDSPTGILFGQQICPPVLLVTWSPPSLSYYYIGCCCWRWFIVSLQRLGSWWYYAMVAVLTRGSDARLACTSS